MSGTPEQTGCEQHRDDKLLTPNRSLLSRAGFQLHTGFAQQERRDHLW